MLTPDEQVRAASDRLALRQLVDRYAVTVDDRDSDGFVDLFEADAVVAIYPPGANDPAATFEGHDAIREISQLLARWELTSHQMAGHVCDVDGETATGRVHCVAHHLRRRGDRVDDHQMVIHYHDTYAATTQRGWRFRRREVRIQWTGDHPATIEAVF